MARMNLLLALGVMIVAVALAVLGLVVVHLIEEAEPALPLGCGTDGDPASAPA
jgi:hypothetical protein